MVFKKWLSILLFSNVLYLCTSQRDFSFNANSFNNNPNRDFNPYGPPTPTREPNFFENVSPQRERDPFNPFNNPGGQRRDFGYSPDTFNYGSTVNIEDKKCLAGWNKFKVSCYRFVRSPIRNREDARRNCQARENYADLVSINNAEEHAWIVKKLLAIDPQHRIWYVSAKRNAIGGTWVNADDTQLVNLDDAFLSDQPLMPYITNNYLAYSFSERRRVWGFLKISGQDHLPYICEMPLANVPDTVVDNRDFSYGLEIDDPKKIPMGPFFIQEPKSEVFDLSRNILRTYISLSCLAGGWPAPTYDWYKEEYVNNTLLSILIEPLKMSKYTVSGGSLIIDTPTQKEDRGNYHCVATNKFGSIVSETVSLSFGYIGEFILTRGTETGNQYWGKAIFCDPPQHFPSIHYYWSRKYFPNLVEEDQRVFVSYDGNLYISAVDVSDQGNYSCNVQSTVSNSGRNGPLFSLQVIPNANYQQLRFPNNFPKVFPEAPSANGEVRLECVAFGYPVPSYNWTRRGASLPRSSMLSNYNRVLTIPNITVEDQGDYSCRATNSRMSIESVVTLRIQAAPHFTIRLENQHMDKDSDLQWNCESFGIPDVSYQWYRNGKLLSMETLPPEDIGRYKIQDNVLSIKGLDEERDAGMYQCRANNSLAAKFSSAQLRVLLLRPSFKKRPLDSEILGAEGGNVTIKCEPEAAPRPRPEEFTWKKDGNYIGDGGRRKKLPNGSLLINPVSREDQGIYTCLAKNIQGFDESSGRLTVLRRPVLLEQLQEKYPYAVGNELSFTCKADADESLDIAYVWRHNGIRLDEVMSQRIRFNPKNGFLEIYNLTLADRGVYECEVNTWVGKLTTKTQVDISGPPGPPGGVQARDFTSTNSTLIWTNGATNGAEPVLYVVQGRTQWDPVWRTLVENVTARDFSNRLSVRLGESGRKEAELIGVLSPWSAYEFRVSSANAFGYGPFSAPSPQYNTLPHAPFIAPRKVEGGGGKTGSLTITWNPLPPKDQNAPGVYYKIFWRRKKDVEDEYQERILKKWGNIGSQVVSIPSQYYYTLYEVKVQTWNDKGSGPISPPVPVYSAEDMPQAAPSLVIPKPHNSTAINVTWVPVDESREKMRGELLGYRIRYWPRKGTNLYDPEAINYLSRSKDPFALIKGLIPNTYYYVQVMAYNSAGPGPASEPQFERTLKKAPQKPPTAVNVIAIDPSTILITWRYVAPTVEEEALSGYKVRIWEADQDISQAKDTIVAIGSRKLEVEIGKLEPGKSYILRVLAYSLGGDGKMSSPNQEFMLGDPQSLRSFGWRFEPGLWQSLLCSVFLFYFVCYISEKL